MRVLVVSGSQNVPVFIGTLIDGLVEAGCSVGLYGSEASKSILTKRQRGVTPIIANYSRLNRLFLLLDCMVIAVARPSLLLECKRYYTRSGIWKVDMLRYMRLLKILRFRPDIVHIQWVGHLSEFIRILEFPSKFRVVISLRGRQINISPIVDTMALKLYEHAFPKVRAFHAVSYAIKEIASKYGADPSRVVVIYSPVPDHVVAAFDPSQQIIREPLRVLSIGRFHWKKGYQYAIDAMKIVKKYRIDFHYTIVSAGEVPLEMLHQINGMDLSDNVSFVNGVAHDRIVDEMKKHSVFLLPSVEEGIANVVLEAMAIGLPVVSTDCGGMAEVILNSKTGMLVRRRDSEAIARALLDYCEMTDQQVNDIRFAARALVSKNFNRKVQIEKFISLYKSLI